MHRAARFAFVTSIVVATLFTGSLSALAVTSISTDISTGGTLSVSGNADFDTNTLFVNAAGNLVGILTTAPSSELDVRDGSPTPTTNIFQVANFNDSTRYLTVSSTTTFIGQGTSGTDLTLSDGLVSVCADGSCPAASIATADGELFVEGDAEVASNIAVNGNTALGDGSGSDTLTFTTALTTGTLASFQASAALSSGTLLQASSTSNALTSGSLFVSSLTSSNVSAAQTGFLNDLVTDRTFGTAGTFNETGSLLRTRRLLTSNDAGVTINASGDVSLIVSDGTQTTGTLNITGNVLELQQNYAAATGAALNIVNAGAGADIALPSTAIVDIGNGGSVIFRDGTNTLCTITDAGTTGNFTCSGTVGSGGGNLNQAYLAATGSPEISISPSIGALTIADTLSGTGNIFEIQNRTTSAGDYSSRYFTVSATAVGIFSTSPVATLTIDHPNGEGNALAIRTGGTQVFAVDHQGNVSNDRGMTVARSITVANQTDEFWDFPALKVSPFASFNDDLISVTLGGVPRLTFTYTGQFGILTSTPSSELDVRDNLPTPTTNIFQVANLNDSSRYFTVSSTSTSIQTNLDLEDGTGSVATDAVTINAITGVITDTTDINTDTTRAAITFTNSRIVSTSVVTATMCSTPDTNAMLIASVTPGAGSATLTVRNAGTANQTATWKLCFRVSN